jgi:hypothetical protein
LTNFLEMENNLTPAKIVSMEDVDREIEAVKQRIKLKEAALAEDFNVLPKQLFSFALSPLSSAVASFVGGSFLLKIIGGVKNFITGSISKKDNNAADTGEKEAPATSFIVKTLKSIGWVGLLKLGAGIIRRI